MESILVPCFPRNYLAIYPCHHNVSPDQISLSPFSPEIVTWSQEADHEPNVRYWPAPDLEMTGFLLVFWYPDDCRSWKPPASAWRSCCHCHCLSKHSGCLGVGRGSKGVLCCLSLLQLAFLHCYFEVMISLHWLVFACLVFLVYSVSVNISTSISAISKFRLQIRTCSHGKLVVKTYLDTVLRFLCMINSLSSYRALGEQWS